MFKQNTSSTHLQEDSARFHHLFYKYSKAGTEQVGQFVVTDMIETVHTEMFSLKAVGR
jgi:hypothetical protein